MKMFYFNLIIMLTIIFTLAFIFYLIELKENLMYEQKNSFECGFYTKNVSFMPFSINYFYITLIFLIFDLEILMLAPMFLFKIKMNIILAMMILIMYFTAILAMEWLNGMLEWKM